MNEMRLACASPGCPNTILPATAARTGGYCGPCDGKRRRAARDEGDRRQRVDSFAGLTDPADVLWVMFEPRKHDPLIEYAAPPRTAEQLCAELTAAQAGRLVRRAVESVRAGARESAERVAALLAAFTDVNLDDLLDAFVDRNRFAPPLAFRRAGQAIRDRVLAALDAGVADADDALQALAWIGGAQVERAFRAYDDNPPAWVAGLFIKPSAYARTAAWEISESRRRPLAFDDCLAMTVATVTTGSDPLPLRVAEPTSDPCPWCGRAQINLLTIDLTVPRFAFLGVAGPLIEVRTCEVCTCFTTVYADLDAKGRGRWAAENAAPATIARDPSDWPPLPWAGVNVALAPRRPTHAADWCLLPTTLSQLGGLPAWVQDPEYPSCVQCGQTMTFLAQVDTAAFPRHEGVYYAFICRTCRTTATHYQQS